MARTHRTAKSWLFVLGLLWLAFFGAVVIVMITQGTGPRGLFGAAANDEEDDDIVAVAADGGWFSEEQALRGGDAYAQECAQCHGTDLEGGVGPALAGDTFWDRWEGDSVHAFYEVTRQTMPQDAPGSLDDQTYADITAYVLQVNDFPHGDSELPPDESHLQELTIDRAATEEVAEDRDEPAVGEADVAEEREPEPDDPGAPAVDAEERAEEPTEEPAPDDEPAEDEEPVDAEAPDDADEPDEPADPDAADEAEEAEEADDAEEPAEPTEADEAEEADDAEEPGEPTEADVAEEVDEAEEPAEAEDPEDVEEEREAPEAEPADAESPDDEGWFTQAQVQAGESAYQQYCAHCHGAELRGSPPLIGGDFPERYRTVWELYQFTRQSMPLDAPGSLSDRVYADAVAFILHANGYPTGGERLEPVRARMEELELDPELASDPSEEPDENGEPEEPDDDGEPEQNGEPEEADEPAEDDEATENDEPAEPTEDAENDADDDPNGNDEADDGWFTEEQAEAGQEPYQQHCAQCHGDDLQGDPPLVGDDFLANYDTVWDLFQYTRDNMPQDDPGSLDDETYADIIAHILHQNDFPAGDEELPPDEDALADMELDPDAADAEPTDEADDADDQPEPDQNADEPDEPEAEEPQPDEAPAPEDEAEREDGAAADRLDEDQTLAVDDDVELPRAPGEEIQAERGERTFQIHCSRCHGENLQGNVAPALAGEVFMERWGGHPVDWLLFQALASMPPHAPRFLPDQDYADVIVYVLTENGVLEGFEEYGARSEELRRLVIRPLALEGEPQEEIEERVEQLRETLHEPHEAGVGFVGEPLAPLEWPDDPGAAPVGTFDAVTAEDPELEGPEDGEPEDEENGEAEDAEAADEENGEAEDAEAEDEENGEPEDAEAEDEENGEAEDAEAADAEATDDENGERDDAEAADGEPSEADDEGAQDAEPDAGEDGEDAEPDTDGAEDGGAEDGGAEDGGAEDGGADDPDGGAADDEAPVDDDDDGAAGEGASRAGPAPALA
jgi:mono/diheme cytochrome c family protein